MLISHIIYDKDVCVCDPKYEVNLVPQKKVVNLWNAHFRELCLSVSLCAYLSAFMCAYWLSCPCVCKESLTTNISMYREDIEDTRTCQPLITSCR